MLNCPFQNCEHCIKRTFFPLMLYDIGICMCLSIYFFSELVICCEGLQYERSMSYNLLILYNIASRKLCGVG
jgi:hypothetical protein